MKILSIDAWAEADGSWSWNAWYNVGEISKEQFEELTTDKLLRMWFRDAGYTNTADKKRVCIVDDQYNIVICDAKTGRPLYAIEYGPEY